MKDTKKIMFGLLFLFGVLATISLVSAISVVIDAPAASSTISGATVNVSVTATTPGSDWNCTIYGQSTLTANSSWATLGGGATIGNNTDTIWNMTIDSAVVEDANNYIINATCINSTDTVDDTNTGITVDNTVPVAASSLSPADASTDGDGSITFSGTVTGTRTTSCTLQFDNTPYPTGGNGQAMTHTGDTCSLTLSNVPDQVYTWFIRASDETNTTDATAIQVIADIQTGGGGSDPTCGDNQCDFGELPGDAFQCDADCVVDGEPTSGSNMNIILIILGVGLVLWFVFKY